MTTKRAKKRSSKRTPVGGNTQKLFIPEELKDPNFVYRWVVDSPGRVRRFEAAGYEVVEDDRIEVAKDNMDSSRYGVSAVVTHVGRTRDESNTPAVLMRIHKDYYEEDQKAKEEEIREIESSMYRQNKGQEGFYEDERKRSNSRKPQ